MFDTGRKRLSDRLTIIHRSIIRELLHLRKAREGEHDHFRDFLSNRDVMQYWGWPADTAINQTKPELHSIITLTISGVEEFVIVLAASESVDSSAKLASKDKVIGTAGIWDQGRSYSCFTATTGVRGYMIEVLIAFVLVFWHQGFEKIFADVDPRSEGRIKLLNKFVFVETGRAKNTFRTCIGWCDGVYLELKRSSRP